MYELYKQDTFLKAYLSLSINERINTKFIDYRALANTLYTDLDDNTFRDLLPKVERI